MWNKIGGEEGEGISGFVEDEKQAAVATLQSLAANLQCSCVLLRERKDSSGILMQYLIRRLLDHTGKGVTIYQFCTLKCFIYVLDFLEIRVAVVGNVDAGKSTLLGVLTHGELDNGRGHARQKLFRHKHEMESGRTSSVGNDILGFDSEGILRI